MKKNNEKGFVLAETLVVTVFLMLIFTMLVRNFYPLIGEYEKREGYNDIDSLYSIYWVKRLIEQSSYQITDSYKKAFFQNNKYVRFECSDIVGSEDEREFCQSLLTSLEISGCNNRGNGCDIFITNYQIGSLPVGEKSFKDVVKEGTLQKYNEFGNDISTYMTKCINDISPDSVDPAISERCQKKGNTRVFQSHFQDYVNLLPDYTTPSLNDAKYRVVAIFHHKKDNNNYYSYATIEVIKG